MVKEKTNKLISQQVESYKTKAKANNKYNELDYDEDSEDLEKELDLYPWRFKMPRKAILRTLSHYRFYSTKKYLRFANCIAYKLWYLK